MNQIRKQKVSELGYGFIEPQYLPEGKDEYYLRNLQHRTDVRFRHLTKDEIAVLEKNDNSSDNWNNVLVSDLFDPNLIRRCSFFGLVRIGHLEAQYHEFNNLRMAVGLYNSVIISSDIGNYPAIDNVNYMSHYIIGNDVMLANINELATTNHAKFGNGVVKQGESESVRIWLEICNENTGRKVLPFNGMLAADAWIWSKYRDDEELMERFRYFTDKKFDTRRGYYGKIGDRTVIKNCKIIKDVWIGSDAYLKGANKLKNLTINSSPEAKSQIGEGCELVNGIIGFGCRIFYGVKAVRFVMGSNSQLKYGARLINSYLGDNSTISCCEVLNSLIFPSHEQHHNNSFLCAATVLGQSNLAAGATIGSNHNSRGADGELIAGRGFWPGLCVSLKHNSRFASYTLIAKGDYPAELNIPLPFSLVSQDLARNQLLVMPAYWFMHNMYALARNAAKYDQRDKRTDKTLYYEYDFLAPDTVNEMFEALKLLKQFTGKAVLKNKTKQPAAKEEFKVGEQLLEHEPEKAATLTILADGFENSKRETLLQKVPLAYQWYKDMILFYGINEMLRFATEREFFSWDDFIAQFTVKPERKEWKNVGSLLMTQDSLNELKQHIKNGSINSWDEVHEFYKTQSRNYPHEKRSHARASLLELLNIPPSSFSKTLFIQLLKKSITIREKITECIIRSRAKDYENPFRKITFDSVREMEKVVGRLQDNEFIRNQKEETENYRRNAEKLIAALSEQEVIRR
ncbi:MAG: DUF4954 family protein [Chitinophagaceae bacterium]|nr:DUF4954 family protein [Chitinophagaceae bacterium]